MTWGMSRVGVSRVGAKGSSPSEGVGKARGLEVCYIARIVNGGPRTGYDISRGCGLLNCRYRMLNGIAGEVWNVMGRLC